MIGYTGAIQIPNGNYFADRDGLKPLYIIIHATAGGSSAQNIATYFASTQGTANPVSSHYVVGQDGTIVQCVSETDGAWANGAFSAGHDAWWGTSINPNETTISIEHVKPSTDNSDALTPAQQAASFTLIEDICRRWGIPKRLADGAGGITGHFSLDPVNRQNCPGPYPWDALWAYLQGSQGQGQGQPGTPTPTPTPQEEQLDVVISLQDPMVATYYQESPQGQWLAKQTGKHVKGAILYFFQRFGGSDPNAKAGLTYLGLPLTEELNPNSPGHPEVRIQAFERGTVAYDPKHVLDNAPGAGDVYVLHVEASPGYSQTSKDLATLRTAYNAVVTEKNSLIALREQNGAKIADLQKQLATATATPGNPEQLQQLQQQVDTLTTRNTVLTNQITGLTTRLAQIATMANVA